MNNAPITEVWTYAIIDMDLLTDDVSSASGVLPGQCYLTRDAARRALIEDLRSRWDEAQIEETIEPAEDMPEVVFREMALTPAGVSAPDLTAAAEWLGDDTELLVYSMRVKG